MNDGDKIHKLEKKLSLYGQLCIASGTLTDPGDPDLCPELDAAYADVMALYSSTVKHIAELEAEITRWRRGYYPHMCRMDHQQIGHTTDEEQCPVCAARDELESEIARWRATARRMASLARVNRQTAEEAIDLTVEVGRVVRGAEATEMRAALVLDALNRVLALAYMWERMAYDAESRGATTVAAYLLTQAKDLRSAVEGSP